MPANTSAGVYLLAAEHAEAVQLFATDVVFAGMADVVSPPSPTTGVDMVTRTSTERAAGTLDATHSIDQDTRA
jgi:hypothetical protein